ncbi:MAG: hypothetical protein ACYC3X_11355 [Pirellulaceae bacterium]
MRAYMWCLVGLGALLVGCSEQPVARDASPPAAKSQGRPMPPPPPVPKAMDPPAPPVSPPAAASDTTRVKAEVGVGVKGQTLEDPRLVQMIVAPARALFHTEQRVVFEVQIPKAMQLYEASNGKRPATEAEFMEQIIRANQIVLPELPAGQRYVYDPATGELMVEKHAG